MPSACSPPTIQNEPKVASTVNRALLLDESQLCSIQAMEHAFLLVQGPPGTGKSYVGVRMARLVYDLRNAVMEQKDAERKAALQRTLQPYVQEQVWF